MCRRCHLKLSAATCHRLIYCVVSHQRFSVSNCCSADLRRAQICRSAGYRSHITNRLLSSHRSRPLSSRPICSFSNSEFWAAVPGALPPTRVRVCTLARLLAHSFDCSCRCLWLMLPLHSRIERHEKQAVARCSFFFNVSARPRLSHS